MNNLIMRKCNEKTSMARMQVKMGGAGSVKDGSTKSR
jgi:hypothetical protein